MVTSADGAAAYRGRVGPLTSPADQEILYALRSLADVVLVGAGTVRAEGYEVPLLLPHLAALRSEDGLPEQPRLAVVSRRIDLDLAAPVFTADRRRVLLITCASAPRDRVRLAEQVADVVIIGGDHVNLTKAIELLAEDGLRHVLTEGGPNLLTQLLTAGLVDELCLTVASTIAAGSGLRITAGLELEPPATMTLTGALTADDNVFLSYSVDRA